MQLCILLSFMFYNCTVQHLESHTMNLSSLTLNMGGNKYLIATTFNLICRVENEFSSCELTQRV